MRKRQFGKGREILAQDHNLAQNYGIINIQELIQDAGVYGIISGATCTSAADQFYVNISPTVARDYIGNRIYIPSLLKVSAQPTQTLLLNQEIWITLYAVHEYIQNEQDIDEDESVYYKNWQDTYTIIKLDGVVADIGLATRPTVPANGILLCDVLINGSMSSIVNGDVYTNRQELYTDTAGTSLTLSDDLTVYGLTNLHDTVNLNSSTLKGVSLPTAGDEVGDRNYNDSRYVNITGDVMSGSLDVPAITTLSTSTGNLSVAADADIDGRIFGNDGFILTGNIIADGELDITGQIITDSRIYAGENITGKSLAIPWGASKHYYSGELITYDNKIYQAKDEHTSTSTGIFTDDVSHWYLAGGGGGTVFDLTVEDHGFSVGEAIRIDTTFATGWARAIADEYGHLAMFVVSNVADEDNFTAMASGYVDNFTGLTPNQWHYLSQTSSGVLTTTEPLLSQPILFATSTTEGYVFAYRPNMGAEVIVDEFTSTFEQTEFTLSKVPVNKDYMIVAIEGTVQNNTAFSVLENTLTIASPLLADMSVKVFYINNISVSPEANIVTDEFYVTSTGETTFRLTKIPRSKDFLDVSVNGFTQSNDSYTITSEGDVIFTESLTLDDFVRVCQFYTTNIFPEYFEITKYYQDIREARIINTGENGLSVGPITINLGITVTVAEESTWAII